jgi:hypothetical protein
MTFGSSTATCPTGQRVLFGGFENAEAGMRRTANNRRTVDLWNLGLERVAAYRWRVSAYLPTAFTGDTVVALTSIAYCAPGPAPRLVSRTINT